MKNFQIDKAIGGYFFFETNQSSEYHTQALRLNLARSAVEYILTAGVFSSVYIPKWCCDSLWAPVKRMNTPIHWYNIDEHFMPVNISPCKGDLVIIINFYGLINSKLQDKLAQEYPYLLIDNSQAFFSLPQQAASTVYSARKFFGVPDGAYLYTNYRLSSPLDTDSSYRRFEYLFKRLDLGASEAYEDFKHNEEVLSKDGMKRMSKSTQAVLNGIDYKRVKMQREKNWAFLDKNLKGMNNLKKAMPPGPMCYPFMCENGNDARRFLIGKKIYVPIYWKDALIRLSPTDLEYSYVNDILPLPIDQRYTNEDMRTIVQCLEGYFG